MEWIGKAALLCDLGERKVSVQEQVGGCFKTLGVKLLNWSRPSS
jgi:hypothetical protein